MPRFDARLESLEKHLIKRADIVYWDWANDPYYLALEPAAQKQMGVIMGKIHPHLPHDPVRAMETLSLEELEEFEKFYVARFPKLAGVTIEELREACK